MAFYPEPHPVPTTLRTSKMLLAMLSPGHVELDYEALMESADRLRTWSGTSWPADDFTIEGNLEDLTAHQREHLERDAFTYTVLAPHGDRCLGCVYITPVADLVDDNPHLADWPPGSAAVDFWVRTASLEEGLDRLLLDALVRWFDEAWEFDRVAFAVLQDNRSHRELLAERFEILAEADVGRRGTYDLFG